VRRLVVLTAIAVAACAAASTAGAVTAPPVPYTDPAGDAGTAPDITGVSATNDDHGLYSITITFATPYTDTAGSAIVFDSDQNPATGDQAGADYLFGDDHGSHSFGLYSWSGSDWKDAPDTTAGVTIGDNDMSVTFTVNRSELANSTRFNFYVVSIDGDGSAGHRDDAPSAPGWFTYTSQTVFTLSAGSPHVGAAKAGGTWTVSMSAVRSDTSATVGAEGTVTCSATEGSKKLAVVSRGFLSSGGGGRSSAVCVFRVPKKPKHAAVHATVTVSDGGQSATSSFAATTR
jgi:hypothetical protein